MVLGRLNKNAFFKFVVLGHRFSTGGIQCYDKVRHWSSFSLLQLAEELLKAEAYSLVA